MGVAEHLRHIAQQPLAVEGLDMQADTEAAGGIAPAHLHQPPAALLGQGQHIGAILAMDGDALPHRNVADDGIAGHRPAACRQAREQVADTANGDLPCPAVRPDPLHGRGRHGRFAAFGRNAQGAGELPRRDIGRPQRRQQVLAMAQIEVSCQGLQIHRVRIDVELAQLALQDLAPRLDMAVVILFLEPAPHLGTRPRGTQVTAVRVHPVAAGARLSAGEHLDPLAGTQAVGERHDAPIDPRAAAAMADLGMDGIGEVQRRGPLGQVEHVALRREHEHAVGEEIRAEVLEQALVVLAILEQPAQSVDGAFHGRVLAAALLVAPVRGHPVLGELVHLLGTDLHLHHPPLGADNRGMQGLVAVVLGLGDVVVELVRQVLPQIVHHAQGHVALRHRLHDDTHRQQVGQLLQGHALALHLLPDAVQVLGPAVHLGLDAGLGQRRAHALDEAFDVGLTAGAVVVHGAGQLTIGIGLEMAEGQVLQLPFELGHAEPIGQRCIEIQRLSRDAAAHRLGLARQPAQPLHPPGQLDQHRAHVVHRGQQHATQGLGLVGRRLAVGLGAVLEGVEPVHLTHQGRHRVAELRLQAILRPVLAQARVAQQRSGQGLGVHAELLEDDGRIDARGRVVASVPGIHRQTQGMGQPFALGIAFVEVETELGQQRLVVALVDRPLEIAVLHVAPSTPSRAGSSSTP